MLKRTLAIFLIVTFAISSLAFAQTTELTVNDKLAQVEKAIYGAPQTGALVDRINKLDQELFAISTKEAIMFKADKIYDYTFTTTHASTSLMAKLNALEWSITHSQTLAPVKVRLEKLENYLVGSASNTSITDRVEKLSKLAYASGKATFESVTIPQDQLIKIKTVTPLDSRTTKLNDEVIFQAAADLYIDDILVIPAGAQGIGKVTKVDQAKNFGRSGKIEVSFDSMRTIDASEIKTILGEKAKEETKSLVKAAGASVAGLAILGPVGIVGGAFIKGEHVVIPEGTEMFIQVHENKECYGLVTK